MSELSSLVFYVIAFLTVFCALGVVLVSNPIYCALLLACTMIGVSAVFFTLEAYFVAAAQLIIYAGAVVVLFVMVMMLFNLREEKQAFSRGAVSFLVKMASAGFFLGLVVSAITWVSRQNSHPALMPLKDGMESTRLLAGHLFSKYIFGFELVGVVLLVVLIGAIGLARSRGGTHARP
jgi:NADH-quinone oxidoreductase subunit J